MSYRLLAGTESLERVELLVSLTRINSFEIRAALKSHFVSGFPESTAAAVNGVDLSNLRRAVATLNSVAETVEKIKELDLAMVKRIGR